VTNFNTVSGVIEDIVHETLSFARISNKKVELSNGTEASAAQAVDALLPWVSETLEWRLEQLKQERAPPLLTIGSEESTPIALRQSLLGAYLLEGDRVNRYWGWEANELTQSSSPPGDPFPLQNELKRYWSEKTSRPKNEIIIVPYILGIYLNEVGLGHLFDKARERLVRHKVLENIKDSSGREVYEVPLWQMYNAVMTYFQREYKVSDDDGAFCTPGVVFAYCRSHGILHMETLIADKLKRHGLLHTEDEFESQMLGETSFNYRALEDKMRDIKAALKEQGEIKDEMALSKG